jgi:hypothetical protein
MRVLDSLKSLVAGAIEAKLARGIDDAVADVVLCAH